MESTEELTTPPTPREFENPFEYVDRKRKGKKKGKSFTFYRKKKQQDSDDSPQQANEDIEAISTDSVPNNDYDAEENENGTSWDSQMKTQPAECLESNEYSTFKVELIDDNTKLPVPENNVIFNTRALAKHSITYELEKFEKHALFIFSHQSVNGYSPNLNIEKDEAELTKTFSKFGFEIIVERDLTKEELLDKLREFSKQDFTDYGCVAVAILTISSKDSLIWAKDEPYSELELIKHFRVDQRPTLITKPKIFIIQASQGIEEIKPLLYFPMQLQMGRIQKDIDEDKKPYTLPVESDLLLIHSSYSGKPPNSIESGSWFIQKLCCKIDELAPTHDLETILTEVKREIGIDRSEHDGEINKYWLKIPVTTSTFIRKLYMRKFGEKPLYAAETQVDFTQPTGETEMDDGAPKSSPKVHTDSCCCFLEHFVYMKECLKNFIEDHPDDVIARSFFDVASTFDEGVEFNSAKDKMLQAISHHLSAERPDYNDLKYLHPYSKIQ